VPLAHVCPACGNQLARTRALPDAAYALPIVACPCGYAVVRRRHPILARWRSTRAAVRASIFLILHIAILTALSLANGGFIAVLEKDLRDMRITPGAFATSLVRPSGQSRALQSWIDDGGGVAFLIGFALTAVAVGTWLRAALAHWRWPTPILAWTLLVSAWIWFESIVWPLTWLHGRIIGVPARYSGLDAPRSIHCLQILIVSILVSTVATPFGRAVSRGLTWSRQRRFIKTLNKRRKTRRGE
jgi:hypothetical protein